MVEGEVYGVMECLDILLRILVLYKDGICRYGHIPYTFFL